VGAVAADSMVRAGRVQTGSRTLELRYADGERETLGVTVARDRVAGTSISYLVPSLDMVLVEGGTFQIGDTFGDSSANEKPVHAVTVSSFWMATYEITFEQYDRSCDETGRRKPADQGWGRGKGPVIEVSWLDAAEYCNWLSRTEGLTAYYSMGGSNVGMTPGANGYRLPTEAEWEYAARGGKQGRGTRCAGASSPDGVARCASNAGGKTQPVGGKQANEPGLCDMSGNVWEWSNDWYGSHSPGAQTDPTGPASGSYRVFRGGAWNNSALIVRWAYRDHSFPGFTNYGDVFRVVRRGG